MAKITITIMDVPGESMIAIAMQSENPEKEETAATCCAEELLSLMCQQVKGLETQLAKSNEGAMH